MLRSRISTQSSVMKILELKRPVIYQKNLNVMKSVTTNAMIMASLRSIFLLLLSIEKRL